MSNLPPISFEPVDFTPVMEKYSGQGAFRFWCQTVLPLIYDDSLSYYELLNKVIVYLNKTIEDVGKAEDNIDSLNTSFGLLQSEYNLKTFEAINRVNLLLTEFTTLKNYVDNYFENLDTQAEIEAILDNWVSSGKFSDLLSPIVAPLIEQSVPGEVSDWLTENVDPVGSAVVVDSSLSVSGAAADAKVTGDRLTVVEGLLGGKEPLRNFGSINETYDLNEVKTVGLYKWTATHQPTNCPTNYPCMMMVLQPGGSGNFVQMLYPTLPTATPYVRTYRNNAWTDWFRIANTDMLNTSINGVTTRIEQIEEIVNNLYFPIIDQITALEDNDGYITESFDITYTLQAESKILSITAQYTGTMPTIQIIPFNPDTQNVINASPIYELGGDREPTTRSWRIPMETGSVKKCTIRVQIPSGTRVSVRSAEIKDDQRQRYIDTGIKYHGHAGCFAPANTVEAFQIGAELGFNSMVTIPKFTSDGVGVCFHDDASISGDLCWMDGRAISGADDVAISNYTYAQLTENFRLKPISWGILHVPTLDEYFRVCSLTGMAPILSVHSTGFGTSWADGFATIKGLAKKWNVLNRLGIKTGDADIQSVARRVFGTEIGCYIFLSGQTHAPYDILNLAKTSGFVDASATDLSECNYNLVSEYFYTQTVSTGTYYNETMTSMARELGRGFKLSVATTGSGISGPEMMRLINLGVSEFTVDHHISPGLNW